MSSPLMMLMGAIRHFVFHSQPQVDMQMETIPPAEK
jgi:hypothetical protein